MEVNADGSDGVGDKCGAVLMDAKLSQSRSHDGCSESGRRCLHCGRLGVGRSRCLDRSRGCVRRSVDGG